MASANSVKNKVSNARHQVNQIQWQLPGGHDRQVGDDLKLIVDALEEIATMLRDRKSGA